MRRVYSSVLPLVAITLIACKGKAQNEATRQVASGGITVNGWQGKIDPGEARRGQVLTNAKLAQDGNALHVTTGPAVAYWKPGNTARGDYTVKASFTEPKYMNLNDHPHPYGIFIGGNDMGTDNQSYLYCAAYGTGNFMVRRFGAAAFEVHGRGGEVDPAVHYAAGRDSTVTADVALAGKGEGGNVR